MDFTTENLEKENEIKVETKVRKPRKKKEIEKENSQVKFLRNRSIWAFITGMLIGITTLMDKTFIASTAFYRITVISFLMIAVALLTIIATNTKKK